MNTKLLLIVSFFTSALAAIAQQRIVVQPESGVAIPLRIASSLPVSNDPKLALVNSINGKGLYLKNTAPTTIARDIDGLPVSTILNYMHKTSYAGATDSSTSTGDITSDLPATFTFDLVTETRIDGILYWKSSEATTTQFRVYINNNPDPMMIDPTDDVVLPAFPTFSNPEVFTPSVADDPVGSQAFPARLLDFNSSTIKKGRYVHVKNYSRRITTFFLAEIAFTTTFTSTNADLDLLALDDLPLTPAFNKNTLGYQSYVDYETSEVVIEARTDDHEGKVAVRRQGDPSDLASINNGKRRWVVPLHAAGPTVINVTATARNNSTTKAYSVTINRRPGLRGSPVVWFDGVATRVSEKIKGAGNSTMIRRGVVWSSLNPGSGNIPGVGVFENFDVNGQFNGPGTFALSMGMLSSGEYYYQTYIEYSFSGGAAQKVYSPVFTFEVGGNKNLSLTPAGGSLTLPAGQPFDFQPKLQDPGAAITSIRVPPGGNGNFVITVKAQDGSTQDYTVALANTLPDPALPIPTFVDTDEDGMSDFLEDTLVNYGFDKNVAQPELVGQLIQGLYATSSILDMVTGGQVMIQATGNHVNLNLPLFKSDTMNPGSWVPAGEDLEATLPKEGDKEFYRIQLGE